MSLPFGDALARRSRELASPIAVGIDPRPELLTDDLQRNAGESLRGLARAYERFAEGVLDGITGIAPVVKIQIAFFEALGLAGMRAYARIVAMARDRGLLVIGDIKRGDIGTSSEAYAEAHFGTPAVRAGADADAVTLNPYFGRDGCQPFLDRCKDAGKGVFLLVRTSNPTAPELQDLLVDGEPFYLRVARLVDAWGESLRGATGYSSVGAVVGATYPRELLDVRRRFPHVPLLVPGYGAQGGTAGDVAGGFDAGGMGMVIASSRAILRAFRAGDVSGEGPVAAVRAAAIAMRDDLRRALLEHGAAVRDT